MQKSGEQFVQPFYCHASAQLCVTSPPDEIFRALGDEGADLRGCAGLERVLHQLCRNPAECQAGGQHLL